MPEGPVSKWARSSIPWVALDSKTFGGGFIYGMGGTSGRGLRGGLDYWNPTTDPHGLMQEFKRHPYVASLLEGGTITPTARKAISEGGYYSVPRLSWPGGLHCGESAAFPELGALEGRPPRHESGMLAAETAFDALPKGGFGARRWPPTTTECGPRWIWSELYKVRNFHQGFERGLFLGMADAGLQLVTNGLGFGNRPRWRRGTLT